MTSTGRRLSLPALVIATGVIGASLAVAAPGTAQSEPAAAEHSQLTPTSPLTATSKLDTRDKAAVNRAYKRNFGRYLSLKTGWTGNNAHCRAGHTSAKSLAGTLHAINFVRSLGGLAPVRWNNKLSARAQKAALIMSANNALSHFPPRSWKCWSKPGADAAGHSNLALAYPFLTSSGLVKQYMDDEGDSNIVVGHRRWLMYPPTTTMGSGSTRTSNAIWVLGPTSQTRPNPKWVSWPTAGWFPSPLEPNGRWSFSSGNDSVDFSDARVKVVRTSSGHRQKTHVYPIANGYGKPTLVWRVKGIKQAGIFNVTVRGIKAQGQPGSFTRSYTVKIFRPS